MSRSIDILIASLKRLFLSIKPSNNSLPCRCTPPPLQSFLPWLVKALDLEAPELLYASVYLRRLRHLQWRPGRVDSCTPYRLVLAAIAVAHKFLRDNSYTNAVWGWAFQLPNVEVNKAESALLKMLRWNLRVSADEIETMQRPCQHRLRRPILHPRISLHRENAILGVS